MIVFFPHGMEVFCYICCILTNFYYYIYIYKSWQPHTCIDSGCLKINKKSKFVFFLVLLLQHGRFIFCRMEIAYKIMHCAKYPMHVSIEILIKVCFINQLRECIQLVCFLSGDKTLWFVFLIVLWHKFSVSFYKKFHSHLHSGFLLIFEKP